MGGKNNNGSPQPLVPNWMYLISSPTSPLRVSEVPLEEIEESIGNGQQDVPFVLQTPDGKQLPLTGYGIKDEELQLTHPSGETTYISRSGRIQQETRDMPLTQEALYRLFGNVLPLYNLLSGSMRKEPLDYGVHTLLSERELSEAEKDEIEMFSQMTGIGIDVSVRERGSVQ